MTAKILHAEPRRAFTVGDVARFCSVAPRTVQKWCLAGWLTHYFVPGSLDRRVCRSDLIRFLRDHGFPLPPELAGSSADVLLVGGAPGPALPAGWAAAPDAFAAGVAVATGEYRVVVLDAAELGGAQARAIARQLAATRPGVRVGVVLPEDAELVTIEGADFVLKAPVTAAALAEAVGGAVNGKPVTSRSAP